MRLKFKNVRLSISRKVESLSRILKHMSLRDNVNHLKSPKIICHQNTRINCHF